MVFAVASSGVHEGDVRSELRHAPERLGVARRHADDRDALALQQSACGLKEARAVIHDQTAQRHDLSIASRPPADIPANRTPSWPRSCDDAWGMVTAGYLVPVMSASHVEDAGDEQPTLTHRGAVSADRRASKRAGLVARVCQDSCFFSLCAIGFPVIAASTV
jgi:hypothetical protein